MKYLLLIFIFTGCASNHTKLAECVSMDGTTIAFVTDTSIPFIGTETEVECLK